MALDQYRFIQGQRVQLHTISNVAVTLRAWIRVIYDDGTDAFLTVPEVERSALRVEEDLFSDEICTQDGWVVAAEVEMLTTGIKRGQTLVSMSMSSFGCALLSDYCFSAFGRVSLGTRSPAGPAGGGGDRHVEIISAAGTAVAQRNFTMRLSNLTRVVYGYAYYLECSGVAASRVLSVRLRNPLGGLPAGYPASASDIWTPPTITLTADENGMLYADIHATRKNDNATVTVDDITTSPTPFPLWVTPEMPTAFQLQFLASNLDAGDNDALYADVEDWVTP